MRASASAPAKGDRIYQRMRDHTRSKQVSQPRSEEDQLFQYTRWQAEHLRQQQKMKHQALS